ncbi:AAA family ATPase [Mesorhizobium sp. M0254]|uniref:AAA family ATPase n=1 Tax=Mesorhizobium sp. M0254 TaxID=2956927 RepID=UPI003334AE8E
MLIKLDELQEIGRFGSLKHKAPQLLPLTLIFARNGYGKSTICAVLRSAAEGKPEFISARRKLDAKLPSAVKSTWSNGSVHFAAGKWDRQPPKLYIFDQEFVHRNVHAGDSVTRDNKRSLLPIVLGEEGVRLARRIVSLDQEQQDTAVALREQASRIKAIHQSIENVSVYCSVPIPADLDAKIEAAARSVELGKQTVAVKEKSGPRRIELKSLPQFRQIAASTLASVSSDVADKVQSHIDKHALGQNADRWLRFGIDHHRDDTCPFCDQSTKGVSIISAFEAYYSHAFGVLVTDRDAAINSLQAFISGGPGGNFRALLDDNERDFAFWKSVTELPEIPSLSAEQRTVFWDGLIRLEELLLQKRSNPLAVVELNDPAIQAAFEMLDAYNAGIERCAASVDLAKQAVQFANLPLAQSQHLKLLALKARQTEPMASLAAAYIADETKRDGLAAQKSAAQKELTTYAPVTMANSQATINSLLANFGADFQIVDAKANFVGREPNTDFAIAVGGGKVAAGEKSDIEPSFKTVLSAGDKTTLALAFFITQLRTDPKLADAIVVFDDPFNSQDMNRQFETTSQIRSVAKQAAQVIVLSHDPRFLHMIEKDAGGPVRTLQVQCSPTGDGSISPWNIGDELKSLYVRNSEIIREYGVHGALLRDVTEITVLQAIRPFLEDYIRARFPARFPELKMLDSMTDAIEEAGPPDPLFPHVGDLRALNEYTRPNMHGGGQPPDPTALRAQCNRVIGIVGTY